ncbi:MAG TPA: polyprenyl diphosphate synthase [Herbaspirillum sp.]|jgi:undecaprenyl diphosphate synthase
MTYSSSTLSVPEVLPVPRHIAIIMDGNGRWATKRLLPRFAGHKRGVDMVEEIVEACASRGVEYLTLFAFSSENWRRPPEEVSLLMTLFMKALQGQLDKMHRNNIRLKVVGDLAAFDSKLQAMVAKAETQTAANTRLTLTICANYGGRWDIMQAAGKMARQSPGATQFAEADLARHLAMAYAPEPDLFIRTGGEQRISNFLLWQLAYTELYFTDTYWPAFNTAALDLAIASYRNRERRFGRTSEQLTPQAI